MCRISWRVLESRLKLNRIWLSFKEKIELLSRVWNEIQSHRTTLSKKMNSRTSYNVKEWNHPLLSPYTKLLECILLLFATISRMRLSLPRGTSKRHRHTRSRTSRNSKNSSKAYHFDVFICLICAELIYFTEVKKEGKKKRGENSKNVCI